MFSSNKPMAARQRRNPLPPRIASLIRESLWLVLVAAALYVALVLYTYTPEDPGWSHSGRGETVTNAGGLVGAYMADLLLYLRNILSRDQ